jgi:hypothetical protein
MGRAKLEHTPPDVTALRRTVDRDAAHGDQVAEAILDMALDYDDGDPIGGIRNAMLLGVAFWTLLAFGAFLLV